MMGTCRSGRSSGEGPECAWGALQGMNHGSTLHFTRVPPCCSAPPSHQLIINLDHDLPVPVLYSIFDL